MDKIVLTGVLARRKKDGALVLLESIEKKQKGQSGSDCEIIEHELDESADHALDLYGRLRITKGEAGRYTSARLFLQGTKQRPLKFP
jgi:hypothetical protein